MAQNGFTLEGVLYRTWETEKKPYEDKTFHTRKFVLQIHEEYNGSDYYQYIPCELRGETKCPLLDRVEEGWKVKIHCNMRGVKYNPKLPNGTKDMNEEKYFSSVDVWKIENMNAAAAAASTPATQQQAQPGYFGQQPNNNVGNNNNGYASSPETIDDLPF